MPSSTAWSTSPRSRLKILHTIYIHCPDAPRALQPPTRSRRVRATDAARPSAGQRLAHSQADHSFADILARVSANFARQIHLPFWLKQTTIGNDAQKVAQHFRRALHKGQKGIAIDHQDLAGRFRHHGYGKRIHRSVNKSRRQNIRSVQFVHLQFFSFRFTIKASATPDAIKLTDRHASPRRSY